MNFGFVTHFNAAVASVGRGTNFEEDIKLKFKCLNFNRKYKIHSKICISCDHLKSSRSSLLTRFNIWSSDRLAFSALITS